MMRVAINGFGRIGRNFLRCLLLDPQSLKKISVVAINIGPAQADFVAHMFKYDSLMGIFPGDVRMEGNALVVDGHRFAILTESDPEKLPWKSMAIEWVVDCSGRFTKREGALKHITAGAKKVLISAPAKDEDITIIPGVNDHAYDAHAHTIVSLGSCTTNAFLTMLKVMHDSFGVQSCTMTTIHSYTNTQVLLDVEDKDLRRSRAAALNIIPTSTGAMKMVGKVMPELAGRVQALSIRVPVAKVSLIDMTFNTEKKISATAINDAFVTASRSTMSHILDVTMAPLVSSDFSANSYSVVVDGLLTATCGETVGKAFGWYDNEWGYSCRMRDFLKHHAG